MLQKFAEALANDLNISGALGVMHPWIKGAHPNPKESLGVWRKMNSVLSVAPIGEGLAGVVDEPFFVEEEGAMTVDEALGLCTEMDAAKAAKDYAKSDAIRKQLNEAGFEVQQSAEGSTIKKKVADLIKT